MLTEVASKCGMFPNPGHCFFLNEKLAQSRLVVFFQREEDDIIVINCQLILDKTIIPNEQIIE